MEVWSEGLYFSLFSFAAYGAILMLARKQPPPGWKPETYEKNINSPRDPFPVKKTNFFDNET